MEISAGIIYEEIQKQLVCKTNLEMEKDFPIMQVRIWEGDRPEKGVLYLCNQNIPDGKAWKNSLVIGNGDCFSENRKSPFIRVCESISFFQLINKVQDILKKCYEMQVKLEAAFLQNGSFEEILNMMEQTCGIITFLADKDLKYIAMSEGYPSHNRWMGDEKSLPLEVADNLMGDDNFTKATDYEHAFLYLSLEDGRYTYCYNLKEEGNPSYLARFMLQKEEGTAFYGGLSATQWLGEKLEAIFRDSQREQRQEIVTAELYETIRDLLQGMSRDSETMERVLALRGWEKNHIYQVYLFDSIKTDDYAVIWSYYRNKLETLLGDCCAIIFGEQICCVRNLSRLPQDEWDIRQKLVMFLRENLYRAGIGNEVPGIRRLHTGYLQAKAALEIGRNSRSTDWYYKFDNMVLPYIWQQGTKEMEVTDLYHPAVCMLMEYDKKQGTSLAQTVFSYMKNSYNVTHTAQELYIHRTTLLFRLERIEALTGLKWDDWSTRVHLAITFELLQWSNRKW